MKPLLPLVCAIALLGPHWADADETGGADRDCADFASQADAQHYYLENGGPESDPDRLDADGDGVACSALGCPCDTGIEPIRGKKKVIHARVVRVLDGDTIKARARHRRYTVRLIGTDAPETFASGVECGAERALRGLKRLASGRRVTLTTDPTQDRFDHFGRLLAYVRTSTRQLNVAQIGRGWAKAYVFETPVRQYDRFRRAQRRARRHDRGVWALCDGEFHAG